MTDQMTLFTGAAPAASKPRSTRGRGGSGGGRGGSGGQTPPEPPPMPITPIALHEAARKRYLNYAMSVITSRALPDVRDGLKPVQRRILYAMLHNLHLTPEGRYRKSAAVVGEVMAKYHPHGDSSIYEAMVRMAQDFSLRYMLVDGQGNFGSLDGDPAAAMRYTEAKLRPLAIELLDELTQKTVHFRPNYDGTIEEPVVLPARFPSLLVNGTTGIAVGMATNIPPHNLGEVVSAAIALIDEPELSIPELCAHVKGPDFPMGGQLLNTPEELIRIYEKGEGAIRVRGEYSVDPENKDQLIISTIPYGVNKAELVESIAEHIIAHKVPQLVDVRDESTEEIRIVLELKRGAAADVAMAYLYKHTTLENAFHVNMTCLTPTDNPEIGAPMKLNLKAMLQYFLDFRMEVVTKRLQYQLDQIRRRIHILEGFERIFDELDEAIRIIRASDGKADAAEKLMARFFLDAVQTDAILETKLYRLSKLEIDSIRRELAELRAEEERLYQLLADSSLRWALIRAELSELLTRFGDERRTRIGQVAAVADFDPEAYRIAEDTIVIVTRDGWIKRQKSFSDISAIRIREGDAIGWVYPATTRHSVAFFTNLGSAYVLRVDEVPATTGYGEPVQRQFQFNDRERVIGVICYDPRCLPVPVAPPPPGDSADGAEETEDAASGAEAASAETDKGDGESAIQESGIYGVAITRAGKGLRFPIELHRERSTRAGRRYLRVDDKEDGVVSVQVSAGDEYVSLVTEEGRAIIFRAAELNILRGAGKGVTAIRTQGEDRVLTWMLAKGDEAGLQVETNRGRQLVVNAKTYNPSRRGGKGLEIIKRGSIKVTPLPPVVVRAEKEEGT